MLLLVAVSVSGGCESLALTLLARQTFQKVIGITVNHRLVLMYIAVLVRTALLKCVFQVPVRAYGLLNPWFQ